MDDKSKVKIDPTNHILRVNKDISPQCRVYLDIYGRLSHADAERLCAIIRAAADAREEPRDGS